MSPTLITRGERTYAVLDEGTSNVLCLTDSAYLKYAAHPNKIGHRLSRVSPFENIASQLAPELHIGDFTLGKPRNIPVGQGCPNSCRGFMAQWIDADAAEKARKQLTGSSRRRMG